MREVAVVAHRGASGDFPENTASAFLGAIELSVETIEFDVRLTRDYRLVIIHDQTVDRTSDGCGRVTDLNLADIKALDAGSWFADRFAGERYLTLAETLDMMPASLRLNIHIKASDKDRHVLVPAVVQELVRRCLLGTAFVTGNEATVVIARAIAPTLEICTNLAVSRCRDIGCRMLQPGNGVTTPELVAEAHRHSIEVNPFYSDDDNETRRLIACGVDGILTNYPKRMKDLMRRAI